MATSNTEVVVAQAPARIAISPGLVAAAQKYAAAATAASTRRAYASDWRRFETWCQERSLESLPAAPAVVALFLSDLAEAGKKMATIRRALAAIAKAHRTSGLPSPRVSEEVLSVMRGIARTIGTAQVQKAALVSAELREAVSTLPTSLGGLRDRAVLLLGFAGAFRRSELAALEVADVKFTASGMEVTVRRSKTDQEGEGMRKAIPMGSNADTCPVLAVRAWLEAAGIRDGALLRNVNRHGRVGSGQLDGGSIARIIKRAVGATGRSSAAYSGHSLRAGLITSAVEAGKTEAAIMRHTGHRSVGVLRRYVRLADLFADNCVAGIGL